MKRALVAAMVLAFSSCAALQSAASRAGVSPNINVDAGKLGETAKKVDECKAFAAKEVAWPEEVSIGGAVALNLAARTKGGVFVELAPSIKDVTLEKLVTMKDVKPPPGTGSRTDLNKYVNTLGKGLAAFSDRPGITWTFAVLESDTPNAFSAPGGYVFITTGMLKQLDNEAQLAGVLAHEIGHVTGKHALRSYKEAKKIVCIGGALAGNVDVNIGVNVEKLPFDTGEVLKAIKIPTFNPNELSGDFVKWLTEKVGDLYANNGLGPEMEEEADKTAARIMIFAGYDTKELEKVFQKLPDGGGFLSPHPSNKARIATITSVRNENADFIAAAKAPAMSPTVSAAR